VDDGRGGTNTVSASVTFRNVPPVADAGADASINEGEAFSGAGSFTDPGADSWTATVDYGDGTGAQALALNPDKTFSLSHAYAGSGPYTLEVCVTDDDGGEGCDSLTVAVNITNAQPTADAGGPYAGNAGEAITFDGSGSSDADGQVVLFEWDMDGDGDFNDATGATAEVVFNDTGTFTVALRVTDDAGATDTDTAALTVSQSPSSGPVNTDHCVIIVAIAQSYAPGDTRGGKFPFGVYSFDVTYRNVNCGAISEAHLQVTSLMGGAAEIIGIGIVGGPPVLVAPPLVDPDAPALADGKLDTGEQVTLHYKAGLVAGGPFRFTIAGTGTIQVR